ncbi:MAG: trypsin-like peptidase domain-containing protein [Bacteroidota bacterium]|nr:trypsin-like peptidase domain-containing protein [Bacteroidota bacterium]MDP4232010.1 trypsin-like peptidase domain-containing protein [Bacteroidota bacterium]MDP4241283.1 trypsin-like peptidase domain-containing protein [Bacteroidota bacterium]MDP4286675.1 trypsin-like peptidase domain-containing protein [Bacteroidota bacterium]
MQILLIHILSLFSLATPLASCNRNGATPVYSVDQHGPNRDSINQSVSGGRRNAITVAVAKASPAVVGINVTEIHEQQYREWDPFSAFGNDPFFRQFFPDYGGQSRGGVHTQKYEVKALGSGFIISADGYILTNDHVAGNASKIIVTTTDGSEYDAKLIGTDHNDDISLLKIEGKSNLPYLKLGNSGDLDVGEWAIAMGNPFGLFSINDKPTVTVGVISNTGVNLGLENGRNYRDMIQTDAAISSGNSGGPLLNANGDVIGMNSVIRSTAQSNEGAGSIGLGFAIPINKIKEVVDRLRSGDKLDRNIDLGKLGMQAQDVTPQIKDYYNLTSDIGVVVMALNRGGIADKAGIQAGDLVVALDKEKIRSTDQLQSALLDHEVGDVVVFHVLRDDRSVAVSVRLPGK